MRTEEVRRETQQQVSKGVFKTGWRLCQWFWSCVKTDENINEEKSDFDAPCSTI